ncbi:MAG: hypothetical protein SFY56_09770 [Bacteroidota bacterium]|nr:hypothetical protein [Bacteroidota bacterium]
MRKLYYKNKFLIRYSKPLENKRLFTAIKLNIITLKDYNLWPEKVIALDAFCQTGLQWSRVFYKETDYLEMWDTNSDAIRYAKKEFPKAVINCGDSIDAIVNNKLGRRDFNFLIIDTPLPYMYSDGSFEHFVFFEKLFQNINNKAIIIMNVVCNIETIISKHTHSKDFIEKWIVARQDFYSTDKGSVVLPQTMINVYKRKAEQLGCDVNYVAYSARNEYVGMLTLCVCKK